MNGLSGDEMSIEQSISDILEHCPNINMECDVDELLKSLTTFTEQVIHQEREACAKVTENIPRLDEPLPEFIEQLGLVIDDVSYAKSEVNKIIKAIAKAIRERK
jgi:hypothetical protein